MCCFLLGGHSETTAYMHEMTDQDLNEKLCWQRSFVLDHKSTHLRITYQVGYVIIVDVTDDLYTEKYRSIESVNEVVFNNPRSVISQIIIHHDT